MSPSMAYCALAMGHCGGCTKVQVEVSIALFSLSFLHACNKSHCCNRKFYMLSVQGMYPFTSLMELEDIDLTGRL